MSDPRPCKGRNPNVCVAEGCYGEACAGPHWQALRSGSRHAPIPCPFHADQPASRCTACRAEAVPPPKNWRNRA